MIRRLLWGWALVSALALGIRGFAPVSAASPFASIDVAPGSAAALASAAHGLDLSQLDPSCEPCRDFFQFADGGWLRTNPIPARYPLWGRVYALRDTTTARLRRLMEDAAAHPPPDPRVQQVGAYYAACMDTGTVDALGVTPLAGELARANAVVDTASLAVETAHLHDLGIATLFYLAPEANPAGASRPEILGVGQPQLSLPDKSYYLDPAKAALRRAFTDHVAAMLRLAGDDRAAADAEAQNVLAFETSLAALMRGPAELRDPIANTNVMPVAHLARLAGGFPWRAYFAARRLPVSGAIDVGQPQYLSGFATAAAAAPLATLRTELRWTILHAQAAALAAPFVDETFRFYGTTLAGTPEQRPRWERCVDATTAALGDSVGLMYDAAYFSPAQRTRALAMIHKVRATLRDDIATLAWMSPATRRYALHKLDVMAERVGYPDHPQRYDDVVVTPSTYAANRLSAAAAAVRRNVADLGKPFDHSRWRSPSPTINATYRGDANDITFYAGILQAPFFSDSFDDAINYGAMGHVMGHEMTHGFDDQGRHFDAYGALAEWWTPTDAAAFERRAACVKDQFDQFVVADGVHANGALEEGEAIADLGGVTIAYRAFERAMHGKPRTAIDGFTPEQRFFLGFATFQTEADRPAYAKLRASSEPHPLGQFRVNGTLANMPEFAQAFSCAESDAMVRAAKDRCTIW